jgi:hypothetical protein
VFFDELADAVGLDDVDAVAEDGHDASIERAGRCAHAFP